MSEANRLEQAIKVAEWETIDLGKLVSSIADGYRAVHVGRKIDVNVPDQPLHLRCAPDLLAQALDKLVDNAVTLSGSEDCITISVDSDQVESRLSVQNTGSHLPDSLRDRLFDSLVSVRQRRGDTPHLGLGLYIVRLVAEAHGGRAFAHNLGSEGAAGDALQGVEFIIALPTTA